MRFLAVLMGLWLMSVVNVVAAPRLDERRRVGVISAFEPEWEALISRLEAPKTYGVNGMKFVTGTLEGKPVVLTMSSMSMVNATMNAQILIDRFQVTRIVFSGIAGGIDPSLRIGDVVAPARWARR